MTIYNRRFEGEIVTNFMDRKKEILVGCCTNNIGCDEESKGEERSRTKCNGNKELKCYNE